MSACAETEEVVSLLRLGRNLLVIAIVSGTNHGAE
jgi:hypothetical protein